MGQYRWPDFRGIVSQILGGILSQSLTHFARLNIYGLVWFSCIFDRNHPGETYWRHLFEPDWSEIPLLSIVRANLAISP